MDKNKYRKCYFCDRIIISKDTVLTIDSMNEIKRTLGKVPEKEAGKIGNKFICKECLSDLRSLLQ